MLTTRNVLLATCLFADLLIVVLLYLFAGGMRDGSILWLIDIPSAVIALVLPPMIVFRSFHLGEMKLAVAAVLYPVVDSATRQLAIRFWVVCTRSLFGVALLGTLAGAMGTVRYLSDINALGPSILLAALPMLYVTKLVLLITLPAFIIVLYRPADEHAELEPEPALFHLPQLRWINIGLLAFLCYMNIAFIQPLDRITASAVSLLVIGGSLALLFMEKTRKRDAYRFLRVKAGLFGLVVVGGFSSVVWEWFTTIQQILVPSLMYWMMLPHYVGLFMFLVVILPWQDQARKETRGQMDGWVTPAFFIYTLLSMAGSISLQFLFLP